MVLLSLWRFSRAEEERYKQERAKVALNYEPVGATQSADALDELKKKGWTIDRTSVQLGEGSKTYRRAQSLLQRWGHFQLGWTQVEPSSGTSEGDVVAVTSKTLFLWTCNPLRIVYSARGETKAPRRFPLWWRPQQTREAFFTFGQGCIHGHMLKGEEAFKVELKTDGSVWYHINTFSRAEHPLALAFHPLLRYYQGQFARQSARALLTQVATPLGDSD